MNKIETVSAVPAATTTDEKIKKKKKPKLTKEERKARKLEKKRLKLLKIENKKKNVFRAHLGRELKHRQVTYERSLKEWENIGKEAQLPLAQTELKAAYQHLNRLLDTKTHLINRLQNDRIIATEQYIRNVSKHSDLIDYFTNVYDFFLKALKDFYDDESYQLITNFHCDMRDKHRIYDRHKNYYENILFATNLITSQFLEKKRNEFASNKDELNNKHIEYRYTLRDNVIKKMDLLYKQMIDIVKLMQETSTSPKRLKAYNVLLAKQFKSQNLFKQMDADSKKYLKLISNLQIDLANLDIKLTQKFSDLYHERKLFKNNFEILKEKFDYDIELDKKQMRHLAACTHETIKHLSGLEKFGRMLLGIASHARKYETEYEKILPFPDFHASAKENKIQFTETWMGDVDHINKLNLFMSKVSNVQYSNRNLIEQKKHLEIENEQLRDYLRKYCHDQTYNAMIESLKINPFPTSIIPVQEASLMPQLNAKIKHKK